MKIHTSKLILVIDFTVAIALAVIVVMGTYSGRDTSPVVSVAAFWDAQLAVAVGFYYWKAKNENRSIHAMQLVRELADQYGMEAVVSLANTILKD